MALQAPELATAGLVVALSTVPFIGYRGWLLATADWAEARVARVSAQDVGCGRFNSHICTVFGALISYDVRGATYWVAQPAGRVSGSNRPVSEASLRVGDAVPVAYDAANPSDHYAGGWSVVPTPAVLLLVGGVVLLAIGVWGLPDRPDPPGDSPTRLGLSNSTDGPPD